MQDMRNRDTDKASEPNASESRDVTTKTPMTGAAHLPLIVCAVVIAASVSSSARRPGGSSSDLRGGTVHIDFSRVERRSRGRRVRDKEIHANFRQGVRLFLIQHLEDEFGVHDIQEILQDCSDLMREIERNRTAAHVAYTTEHDVTSVTEPAIGVEACVSAACVPGPRHLVVVCVPVTAQN